MANVNELILVPRLEKLVIDGTKLKSDLESLTRDVNSKGGLKLDISIDGAKLKTIEKQLTDLKISLSKIDAIKLTDSNSVNVSAGKLSTVTSEKLKQFKAIKETEAAEKLRGITEQNNAKIEIQNSKLRIQLKKEELALEGNKSSQVQNSIVKAQNLNKEYKIMLSTLDRMPQTWSKMTADESMMNRRDSLKQEINSLLETGDIKNQQSLLQSYKKDIRQLSADLDIAGLKQKSFGDRFKESSERLSAYLANILLYQAILNNINNMIQAIKDIDLAMTELKKVTDETATVYNKFLDDAAVRAKKLGATVSDVVTASADFARLGYSLPDASSLADASVVYKNVGDGIRDISDASSSIISTMKAFNIQASDSMSIVDKFNEVGNNFAISSKGIGDAFLKSASSLSAANNTIDESIGLFVAANNVVQDPDIVGTGIKTISMRLRNTAGELEELGEDASGAAESITKLQTQLLNLTRGKVDIMLDKDTFKSTYQIMLELSQVWGSLSDKAQADITRLIAGVRQGNIVEAIMTNMKEGIDAATTSMNSLGSASKENEVYLSSIAGKSAQLSASFQELSNNLIDSSLVKGGIDLSNIFIQTINSANAVPAKIIAITTAMAGLSAVSKSATGKSFIGFFKDIGKLAA